MLDTAAPPQSAVQLDAFKTLSPLLPFLLNAPDILLWATDTEKWRMFETSGPHKLGIKPGDALKPHDTAALVLKTGKMVSRAVPREVHGIAGHSIALPVPGGVIGTSYSLEREASLRDSLGLLENEVRQINGASDDIAVKAQDVATFMNRVSQSIDETHRNLTVIEELGDMIEDLAEQSRFIALNALIEAARAGAHGTTFAVVAQQMQALSEKTTHSIKNVREAIDGIHGLFEQVRAQTAETEANLNAQSVASSQIAEGLKGVDESVQAISRFTNRF